MVIYVPVWIRLDKPFLSPETKMWTDRWMDRQMDKKRTNECMELHQIQKEPSYDGDLCHCQVWIRLDKLFSRRTYQSNRRVGYMQPP